MIDTTTAKSFKHGMAKGLGFGVGASIALATTTLLAAAAAMKVFSAGEVISADQLNQNFMIAGPEGEVSAFYLANCPDGWALADGSNGTPDLRGRFIRGVDNRTVANGGQDADGIRALGNVQGDAFQIHVHTTKAYRDAPVASVGLGPIASTGLGPIAYVWTDITSSLPQAASPAEPVHTATETRPRNVALIYCIRKN